MLAYFSTFIVYFKKNTNRQCANLVSYLKCVKSPNQSPFSNYREYAVRCALTNQPVERGKQQRSKDYVCSGRGKEKEGDFLLVVLLRVLPSQIQTKLDEGPENSSVEEEEQGEGSPERILFKTLHIFSNLLPPAPPACVPWLLLSKWITTNMYSFLNLRKFVTLLLDWKFINFEGTVVPNLDNIFAMEVVAPDSWGVPGPDIEVTRAIGHIHLSWWCWWSWWWCCHHCWYTCMKASINFPNLKMKQQTLAKSWKGGFCCGSVLHIVSVSSSRFSSVLAVQSSPSMFTPHLDIHHIIIPSSQPFYIKFKIK